MVYPFTNDITRYIHVLHIIVSAILYELSLSVAISYCLDELHALLKASDILNFIFCLWPMHLFDSSVSAFSILFSNCFIPFLSQFKKFICIYYTILVYILYCIKRVISTGMYTNYQYTCCKLLHFQSTYNLTSFLLKLPQIKKS